MTVKKWMLLGAFAFLTPVADAGVQEKGATEKEAVVQEKDDKQKGIDDKIQTAMQGYRKVMSDLNKKAVEIQKKHGNNRAAIQKEFTKLRALLQEGNMKVNEEVVDAVAKGPKSKVAASALSRVIQNGGVKNGRALDLLIANHGNSAIVKGMAEGQIMRPQASSAKFFNKVLAAGAKDELLGLATYGAAVAKTVGFKGSQTEEDAIVAEINSAVKKYGDTKVFGRNIEGFAETVIFGFTKLRVGKVVPEITAEDIDGVEFNLSDYRGKVVFLDFWGDW